MAKINPTPAETAPAPAPAPTLAPPASAPVVEQIPKGPRSYLVMMLLATLMTSTGLARAYRGEQIGWTRFWIFVGLYGGSLLFFWIPFLNILLFLGILGLFIWGAIDVFQLYKVRTDADGGALITSPRDEKFAKGFFIFFIVILALTGLGLITGVIFGAIMYALFMNALNGSGPAIQNDFNGSNYMREFERLER